MHIPLSSLLVSLIEPCRALKTEDICDIIADSSFVNLCKGLVYLRKSNDLAHYLELLQSLLLATIFEKKPLLQDLILFFETLQFALILKLKQRLA